MDWFSFLSVSAVTTALGFVGGVLLKPFVAQAISHGFNRQIEELRSALRKNEDELRSAIKARDDELATLRSTMIEGLSARRSALDSRRLAAVERIWNAAMDHARFKTVSKMTQSLKFETAIDAAAEDGEQGHKLRAFADFIWKTTKLDEIGADAVSPEKERPFVSPILWARFSTYRHMLSFPVARLAAMRTGVGSDLLADPKPLLDAIKLAMPHSTDFVDQHGTASVSYLVEDMETEVLKEIVVNLEDGSVYEKHLEEASKILLP